MTTVFVRAGGAVIEDTVTPACPTLAQLHQIIVKRHPDRRGEPLVVADHTFEKAQAEMLALRKARGYSDLPFAHLPQRNFTLFGTPIVAENESDGRRD